jgi:hypothetical protein
MPLTGTYYMENCGSVGGIISILTIVEQNCDPERRVSIIITTTK